MGHHRLAILLVVAWLSCLGWVPEAAAASAPLDAEAMEARLWLDRGPDPVLQQGDRVRVYFRASRDAYTALFHIDTSGIVRLLFPGAPGDPEWIRGGQDYRLLLPGSNTWVVSEDPGVGYFFLLTSAEPLDFSRFTYSPLTGGWDLSRVSSRVFTDPYVAMDDFVEVLLPDWEYVEFALDYTSYNVGQSYSHPRFLCYDCHTYQPYRAWNPYHRACSSFRVVIYNDPYYYPSTRFRGTQVVHTRPALSRLPQFAFKERAGGEPGTPLVRTGDGSSRRGTLPRELTRGDRLDRGGLQGGEQRPSLRGETGARDRVGEDRWRGEPLPQVIRGRTAPRGDAPERRVPVDARGGEVQGRTGGDRPPVRTPPPVRDRPVLERRRPDVTRGQRPGAGQVRPAPTRPPQVRPAPNRPPPNRPTGVRPSSGADRAPPNRPTGVRPPPGANRPPPAVDRRSGGDAPPRRPPPRRSSGGGGSV
jgi:hypothetical protein